MLKYIISYRFISYYIILFCLAPFSNSPPTLMEGCVLSVSPTSCAPAHLRFSYVMTITNIVTLLLNGNDYDIIIMIILVILVNI